MDSRLCDLQSLAYLNVDLCVVQLQVQPVAELVELSRRWAVDGREIRLNDVIAKGGTLRRTGSLRNRGGLKVNRKYSGTRAHIATLFTFEWVTMKRQI